MKIIYNNRKNRLNWGARSTGKALCQLLQVNHEIVAEFDMPIVSVESKFETYKKVNLKNYTGKFVSVILIIVEKLLSKFTTYTNPRQVLFNDVEKTAEAMLNYQHIDLRLKDLISGIEKADAMIINGEGSMIFGNPTRSELFFFFALMKIAKMKGKKTYYVNAMASENPITEFNQKEFEDIKLHAKYCDLFLLRDLDSLEYLKSKTFSNNILFCPDSLYTWVKYINQGLTSPQIGDTIIPFPDDVSDYGVFDFSKPYLCVSGSSYLTVVGGDIYKKIKSNYVKLVNKLKTLGINVILVESCSTDNFLYDIGKETNTSVVPTRINLIQAISILSSAKILVGGRYHPGIMASLGGTPCVFFNSNSHKTYSLQKLLNYETPVIYSPKLSDNEIENIYNDCKRILDEGNIVRNKIKDRVEQLSAEASSINQLIAQY